MAGSVQFILQILAIFSPLVCLGEQSIPLIAWSNTRSLANTPRISAGRKVTSEMLGTDYMDSILQTRPQNIFLFVFDELSIDDITKYSDAMNANGQGGALNHLKEAMEESSSHLVLPIVVPGDLEGDLSTKVNGNIVHLQEPSLEGVTLDLTKTNLIVMHLTAGTGDSKREAFTQADAKIKSVIQEQKMQSRSVSYTAILTAEHKNKMEPKPSDTDKLTIGRRLLQATPTDTSGFIANYNNGAKCNAYVTAATIEVATSLPKTGSKPTYEKLPTTFANWTTTGSCSEGSDNKLPSLTLTMTLTSGFPTSLNTFSMSMSFNLTRVKFWVLKNKDTMVNFTEASGSLVQHSVRSMLDETPETFSYHCSDSVFYLIPNAASKATALLRFTELQIQPFGIITSEKEGDQFGPANDCVGFFTEAIWMGLFMALIMLIILSMGLGMLANLNVMDKFDDPKGKTITVNVAVE